MQSCIRKYQGVRNVSFAISHTSIRKSFFAATLALGLTVPFLPAGANQNTVLDALETIDTNWSPVASTWINNARDIGNSAVSIGDTITIGVDT